MGGGGVRLAQARDKKEPTLEAKLERVHYPGLPNKNLEQFSGMGPRHQPGFFSLHLTGPAYYSMPHGWNLGDNRFEEL